MSQLVAASVALAYAAGVVTVHRVTVARRKAKADGFRTLAWLDWDALLRGVSDPSRATARAGRVEKLPDGAPRPIIVSAAPSSQTAVLEALIAGAEVDEPAFAAAGFSGGEAHWLALLAQRRRSWSSVIAQLEAAGPSSAREAYFLEWLVLEHTVSPLNLELVSFRSKLRLNRALRRFGEQPELYFARARASALLGFTQAVLDDLARAVYFSREAPFYLVAVNDLPFVAEARPALSRACRQAMATIEGLDG